MNHQENNQVKDETDEILARGVCALPIGISAEAALFGAMAAQTKSSTITVLDDNGMPRTFGMLAMTEDDPNWNCNLAHARWVLVEYDVDAEPGEYPVCTYMLCIATTAACKAAAWAIDEAGQP